MSDPKDMGLEPDEPSGVPFLRRCMLRLLEENATLAGEMREMRHERDEARDERDALASAVRHVRGVLARLKNRTTDEGILEASLDDMVDDALVTLEKLSAP